MNEALYHFVGWGSPTDDEKNFKTLCAILDLMRVGRYPNDNPSAGLQLIIDSNRTLQKGELIQQSITCFCDIPFDDLGIHVSKYGSFGVGVSRHWLSVFGARPVSYVPRPSSRPDTRGHSLVSELQALIKGIQTHLYPPEPFENTSVRTVGEELTTSAEVIDCLESVFNRELLAYLKFYDSDLPQDHPENYYTEREWRKFLPMPLDLALLEVVVPASYEEVTRNRFPQFSAKLRAL